MTTSTATYTSTLTVKLNTEDHEDTTWEIIDTTDGSVVDYSESKKEAVARKRELDIENETQEIVDEIDLSELTLSQLRSIKRFLSK